MRVRQEFNRIMSEEEKFVTKTATNIRVA